jgi:hypothetical protein
VFSSTDNGTNYEFSKLNKEGAISALVNLDPSLMLTVYHVASAKPPKYTHISYSVGDKYIPKEYLEYASIEETSKEIDEYKNRRYLRDVEEVIRPRIDVVKLIKRTIKNTETVRMSQEEFRYESSRVLRDSDIEKILELIEEDMALFKNCALKCIMKADRSAVHLRFDKVEGSDLVFGYIVQSNIAYFEYDNSPYYYEPGLFTKTFEAQKKTLIDDREEGDGWLNRLLEKISSMFRRN